MARYGGIYRSPPPPQQRRPSAILPAEVFPDPPVGSRGRQIVMAIVAAQWIVVPPPQQRRPTVTESGVVVEVFVPQSRLVQQRTILEHWRVDPQPQQPRPRVTSDTPSVFIPKARDYDHVIVASWRHIPAPQRSQPTAILPAEVFPDPPLGAQGRQYEQLVVASWRTVPEPQQRPPVVTEGAAPPAVNDPIPRSRVVDRIILASWEPGPPPRQRLPTVTESGVAVEAPTKGKGRPTVTFIDRQAVLLWVELKVPDPVVASAELAGAPETTVAPAEPAPLILSGAKAFRPQTPTEILVADAAAIMAWAELRVPSPPLELSSDELLAMTLILED